MNRVLVLVLFVLTSGLAPRALAQPPAEPPADDGATPTGAATGDDATPTEAESDEPDAGPSLAEGDGEAVSAGAATVRPSGRLGDPRGHTRVDADAGPSAADAVDAEIPPAADVPAPPLSASAEVSIGIAPSLGFGLSGAAGALGALGGLGGVGVGGRTDFVFAVDLRIFLGLGLSVSHNEVLGSSPSTLNMVEVPLIAQVYLDTPRHGAAVPTLRIVPAFYWNSQEGPSLGGVREALGGRLTFGVGVTWFAADWLALRLLGDIGASATAVYRGVEGNTINAFVAADIGVVVRL